MTDTDIHEGHASSRNVLRRKIIAAMPRALLEGLNDPQDRPWHWSRVELNRRIYERWNVIADDVYVWLDRTLGITR